MSVEQIEIEERILAPGGGQLALAPGRATISDTIAPLAVVIYARPPGPLWSIYLPLIQRGDD